MILLNEVSGVPMGTLGQSAGAPEIRVQVQCETAIERIQIVRDGAELCRENYGSTSVDFEFADSECPAGRHWYYAHVTFATDNQDVDWRQPMPLPWGVKPSYGIDAWTSPVWVTVG